MIKPNFMVNELKEKAMRIKKYRVLMKVKTGNLFFLIHKKQKLSVVGFLEELIRLNITN